MCGFAMCGEIASTAAPETISIIAGGWSFRSIDAARVPGFRIGVNESGLLVRCNVVLSMDRLWTEARWPQLAKRAGPTWIRRSALKNIDDRPAWLKVFECDVGSAELAGAEDRLNGGNSGFCALALAYRMRPRQILLWGFDMRAGPDGRNYWYPAYCWAPKGGGSNSRYKPWVAQFAAAARTLAAAGIAVLNASPSSAIDAFPKVAPEEVLCAR